MTEKKSEILQQLAPNGKISLENLAHSKVLSDAGVEAIVFCQYGKVRSQAIYEMFDNSDIPVVYVSGGIDALHKLPDEKRMKLIAALKDAKKVYISMSAEDTVREETDQGFKAKNAFVHYTPTITAIKDAVGQENFDADFTLSRAFEIIKKIQR